MSFERQGLSLLTEALATLSQGFDTLPEYTPPAEMDAWRGVLQTVAEKMQDNYPYQHPLYAGQMLKPPHPLARLAYMLAMWVNPNNHALDGGKASSAMEKEAVAEIATMFGWQTHLGHLTSGGTVANLEGLWVANRVQPGKKIVASSQAHYTHNRLCGVLSIPFEAVAVDAVGRMDLTALEAILQDGDIGTVVVTLGTTAIGSVDPLPQLLELQQRYGFRIHADCAYGGYFTLVDNLRSETRAAYDALRHVDSIAIDPHKHGLQPYGCGCVLFQDPAVGAFYKHDSPYTYFTSHELHLGEITLECSRAGASAVGLWATQQLLPLQHGGQFAQDLGKGRAAALELYQRLNGDDRFMTAFEPELDIVVWGVRAKTASHASEVAQLIFDEAEKRGLYLALAKLPKSLFPQADLEWDQDYLTCLRSCLMKPEHLDWLERIWQILDEATQASIG